MADITIGYKGSTIATVNSAGTTTLGTSGKYCEDDITVQYAGWNLFGPGYELVTTYNTYSVALKDTEFNTWSPSTTATAILASDTFATFSADMATYDYTVMWTFYTDLNYTSGATLKVMPIKQFCRMYQQTYKRPSNYTNLVAKNFNTNGSVTNLIGNVPFIIYYNGSGSMTYAYNSSYGFYATVQALTFSNSTSNTPTVTIPRPILYARCSTTYMGTARAAEIDKTNSKLYLKCQLFRAKKDAIVQKTVRDLVDEFIV